MKKNLTIGMVGYNFMGRAHSNAWRQAPRFFSLPVDLRLKTICGRSPDKVALAAQQLGWEQSCTDWRSIVEDPQIDIVDITTPNDSHAIIAEAAAAAGKAVLCEKPLGMNPAECACMTQAVESAGVVNMICHNYRRIPALALARKMISEGAIGDRIYHYRARYAQDWIADPAFPMNWRLRSDTAGSGAQGDINSHVVDLARFLVGEIAEVSGVMETFIRQRTGPDGKMEDVTVDDAVSWIGRFQNGALANVEATRFAHGRKNHITLEINGSAGSLAFNFEDMNRLQYYNAADPADRRGFRDILVTEPTHPYLGAWWPPGHLIGYEHTFVHTIADFIQAVVAGKKISPSFRDGWENERVLDAIAQSAAAKHWITLT